MLTSNDRKTREVLIQTRAHFENRTNWVAGSWGQKTGGLTRTCMMGQIMLLTDSTVEWRPVNWLHRQQKLHVVKADALYCSIDKWFCVYTTPFSPVAFNDEFGHPGVMKFLEARIADLDNEIINDAPPRTTLNPVKLLAAAMLGIFGM